MFSTQDSHIRRGHVYVSLRRPARPESRAGECISYPGTGQREKLGSHRCWLQWLVQLQAPGESCT